MYNTRICLEWTRLQQSFSFWQCCGTDVVFRGLCVPASVLLLCVCMGLAQLVWAWVGVQCSLFGVCLTFHRTLRPPVGQLPPHAILWHQLCGSWCFSWGLDTAKQYLACTWMCVAAVCTQDILSAPHCVRVWKAPESCMHCWQVLCYKGIAVWSGLVTPQAFPPIHWV
jgi:hypothetical protein